jgi:hypothetical protein
VMSAEAVEDMVGKFCMLHARYWCAGVVRVAPQIQV